MTIFYCRDYLFRIKLYGWPNYYLPKALYHISNTWQIFVQKYIVLFKIINKNRTFFFFRQKIDLKLGRHHACQMIEIVYKGFTIIKKTKWARQQLHSIVFVCRKGWSKYWFCLYIVVFWTRSLLYYLAAFTSIYLWALARTTDAQWSLFFSWKSQTFGLGQTIWANSSAPILVLWVPCFQ